MVSAVSEHETSMHARFALNSGKGLSVLQHKEVTLKDRFTHPGLFHFHQMSCDIINFDLIPFILDRPNVFRYWPKRNQHMKFNM